MAKRILKNVTLNLGPVGKTGAIAVGTGGAGFLLSLMNLSPLASALLAGGTGIAVFFITQTLTGLNVREDMTRIWERHERLAREVSRNRNEISALKRGLADIASSLTEQGKKHGPSASVEARLINSLVTRLASLGSKPQASLKAGSGRNHVLEMKMIPPPANPPPSSQLDRELRKGQVKSDDRKITKLIRHAIGNDNIALFLQPVVKLPQRRAEMYEVYARIPAAPGFWLPASQYMDLARSQDLLPSIDKQILLQCLNLLKGKANQESRAVYILNVQPATLKDGHFMNELVGFLSRNRDLAPRLVFEMRQMDFETGDRELHELVKGLARLGCRFSLDQVRQRRLDINILKSWHIRFVKLDARWLVHESQAKNGFAHVLRLKKELDSAGIDLVVEKIEDNALLKELLDFNIDYGQGYLFGKPDVAAAYQNGNKKVA